jgi:hypothetical protein
MADPTTIGMALTRDTGPGGYMERQTALLMKEAGDVLKEMAGTPYHAGRAQYAQRVIMQPQMASSAGAPLIVMHTNVITYTTYDETAKTSLCAAPDLNIENAIADLWNTLAGIDAPTAPPPPE